MANERNILRRVADAIANNETVSVQKSDPAAGIIPDFDNSPYARGASNANQMAKRSVRQLRKWSRTNPWIRAAINLRRGQVSRAKWDIVALDSNGVPDQFKVEFIKSKLREPNQRGDSWRSFIEPVVEDLLVLDQGCIEVEMNVGARLGLKADPIANLWGKDGGAIAFDPAWDGSDMQKPRYFEYNSEGKLIAQYKTDELVAMIANPVTYSPLGLSPLEVLAETIEADLAAASYNAKNVMQAAPPGIIDLGEGIRAEQVDAFKSYWEAEISGQAQVAIVGGGKGVKWTPLGASNRDMQFMEWQVYLARKICAVFGVQPQDIGISFDVNKSTAEVGAAFTADNGIAPLLDLIAEYITREIVWRYDKNLRFAYTELGRSSQSAMAEYYKAALSGMPWLRLNDALRERGQDGIGVWGEEVWINTPQGPMPHTLYLEYVKTKILAAPEGDNPPAGEPGTPPPPPGGDAGTPPPPPSSGDGANAGTPPPPPGVNAPKNTPPPAPAAAAQKSPPPAPPAKAAAKTPPPPPPASKAVAADVVKAGPKDLSEGDFVRWSSSGGAAQGRIEYVMREGTLGIPDSDFSIEATPEDPAALIRIWQKEGNGWAETEKLVGHKFSTINKIDPLAEAEKSLVSDRKESIDAIVICDIDGTLDMGGGKANDAVIEFLDEQAVNHRIYIVSARQKERLAETRKFLEDNDVPHDELMLNTLPAGPNSEVEFKKQAAEGLLVHNQIDMAIDNNPEARNAYSELGIKVKDPAEIKGTPDGEDDGGEEIPAMEGKSAQLDLTVPQSVRNEARRGLAWREEYNRGGIGPGQRTARMLTGNAMTIGRVKKMNAYLARHEVDKKGEGWKPGQQGYPSAGRIAWALWGGDAGKRWAGKIVRMAAAAREEQA